MLRSHRDHCTLVVIIFLCGECVQAIIPADRCCYYCCRSVIVKSEIAVLCVLLIRNRQSPCVALPKLIRMRPQGLSSGGPTTYTSPSQPITKGFEDDIAEFHVATAIVPCVSLSTAPEVASLHYPITNRTSPRRYSISLGKRNPHERRFLFFFLSAWVCALCSAHACVFFCALVTSEPDWRTLTSEQ